MGTVLILQGPQDAYGQMMIDYLDGREVWQIVERDDGFIAPGVHPRHYFTGVDQWRSAEQAAMSLARGRVIDVGCGAGRFVRHLRDRGQDVVGIDNSAGAIDACRRQRIESAQCVDLVDVDSRFGTFDTVLLLGGNFGLLGPPERGRTILKRWLEITTPDARILAASRDPRDQADEQRARLIERNEREGRFAGESQIRIRYRHFATPWFDHVPVSEAELHRYVDGTGWRWQASSAETRVGDTSLKFADSAVHSRSSRCRNVGQQRHPSPSPRTCCLRSNQRGCTRCLIAVPMAHIRVRCDSG